MKTAKTFTCAGCKKIVTINNTKPKQRVFIWKTVKGEERTYCYDCDDKKIQGVM